MTMVLVVPSKEGVAESAAVLDGAEAIRELRAILHGAELAFRIGIVVGSVRSAVGLGNAEIGQQASDWLAAHRRAAVGVESELIRQDDLLFGSFCDELPGEFGAFARRDHPADDIAAEDIQNDVEVKVGPLGGPA